VEVTSLMGPGVDPHLYRPTVRDVRALADAQVVVAHGLLLEGRMEDLWPKLERRGIEVVVLSDPGTARDDPHIWMDAALWASAAERAGAALASSIPASADAIRAGADRVAQRWRALDTQVRAAIATIPPERRMLVTAHDAFGHFGTAYGIDVRGVQGISTEAETGLADLQALVDELVARKVPAVFHETSVPDRAIDALVESAAARGHPLRNAAALHSDALGAPGSGADTYEGMMRANVRAIVEALGGDASSVRGLS
jgi:manganese/zinc/iron transport system substrate-binding protein